MLTGSNICFAFHQVQLSRVDRILVERSNRSDFHLQMFQSREHSLDVDMARGNRTLAQKEACPLKGPLFASCRSNCYNNTSPLVISSPLPP